MRRLRTPSRRVRRRLATVAVGGIAEGVGRSRAISGGGSQAASWDPSRRVRRTLEAVAVGPSPRGPKTCGEGRRGRLRTRRRGPETVAVGGSAERSGDLWRGAPRTSCALLGGPPSGLEAAAIGASPRASGGRWRRSQRASSDPLGGLPRGSKRSRSGASQERVATPSEGRRTGVKRPSPEARRRALATRWRGSPAASQDPSRRLRGGGLAGLWEARGERLPTRLGGSAEVLETVVSGPPARGSGDLFRGPPGGLE